MSDQPRSLTVLVVDDEYSILDAMAEVLLWHGHRVLTAGDGLQALQVMRADRPEVALVDVMMPRMDGLQLLRVMEADEALAGLPVLLLTAVPEAVPREVAARVRVLRKPFDLERLLQALEAAAVSGT